ncbi:hypothetical protein J2X92_001723 [Variovorax paradoxus]|nr:hypothetical protein [Variovorax paradoxus]
MRRRPRRFGTSGDAIHHPHTIAFIARRFARLASQAYSKALQLDQNNTAVQPKLAVIRTLFTPAPVGGKSAAGLSLVLPFFSPLLPFLLLSPAGRAGRSSRA